MAEKDEVIGIVRLVTEPEIMTAYTGLLALSARKPAPQLLEGNFVTNIGWWLKIKGYEGKKVKLTVEELSEG